MKEGNPLPVITKLVTQEQVERYAAASGDFNPIHVDHQFAARSQFGRTIAHGMLVAAFVSEMMTVAFGESWLESGRLKLRFRAPVFPGETLTTLGQVKGVRQSGGVMEVTCAVSVRKPSGEAAVTGDAVVLLPQQAP